MLNRRFMMSQAVSSGNSEVVQNGLVVHLDGTKKGDVPNMWKDLQGNMDFEYTNCIPYENGVFFLQGNKFVSKNPKISAETSGTIELAIKTNEIVSPTNSLYLFAPYGNITKQQQFFVGYWMGMNTLITGASSIFKPNIPTYSFVPEPNKIYILSITSEYSLCNKFELTQNGNSYFSSSRDQGAVIGYYGGSANIDKLCAFRIYDRKLTKEEILQNQQHDIDTYFGGVL